MFKLTVDAAGGDPQLDDAYIQPTNLKHEPFVRTAHVRVTPPGNLPSYEAPDFSTDFSLLFVLEATQVAAPVSFNRIGRLFLPWESVEEKDVLEIGAKLIIGSTVESDLDANNVVSVRLDHKDVPRDGTSTAKADPCIGVGMVYPTVNLLWDSGEYPGAKKAAKMVARSVRIFIHEHVVTKLTPVTLGEISARLAKIFVEAGLPSPQVVQKSDADIRAAGFEERRTSRGKRWACNAAKLIDPDKPLTTEGMPMDFFDFWVMWEPALTPLSALEAAESESIMDFDPTTAKKMLLFPMAVVPKSVPQMQNCRANHPTLGPTEYKANFVAWMLAHEIGHGLGLEHALLAEPNTPNPTAPYPQGAYELDPKGHHDKARGAMAYMETGAAGVLPLSFFGPVHKSVLARRFT